MDERQTAAHGFSWFSTPIDRRQFMRLTEAAFAMAGLAACRAPQGKILPYVKMPEQIVPGKPLFYASTMPFAGYGRGVLVECQMGRPIKIEGNPDHPASLGASDVFMQASVLDLYDPDRPKSPSFDGLTRTWAGFLDYDAKVLAPIRAKGGQGLHLLLTPTTSPTLLGQLEAMRRDLPEMKVHFWQPLAHQNPEEGALLAFGQAASPLYDFMKAKRILSIDADFLFGWPGSLRHARDYAAGRRIADDAPDLSRLYVVESAPSITGTVADHRLALTPADVAAFTVSLARKLGIETPASLATVGRLADDDQIWLDAVGDDLEEHRGNCLIVAGREQPAWLHALCYAVNEKLGAFDATLSFIEPVLPVPGENESLEALMLAMEQGQAKAVIVIDGNPAYAASSAERFTKLLGSVPETIFYGLSRNETTEFCRWNVPATHFLETWSDIRAFDGTASIIQPAISPLYDSVSPHEFLATIAGQSEASAYELVRQHWRSQHSEDFETVWARWLHDGIIADSASKAVRLAIDSQRLARIQPAVKEAPTTDAASELSIVFRPDTTVWDGSFSNNGWLQETPKPITTLTWDNAAMVSPETARRLTLETGGMVELTVGSTTLKAPVMVVPGVASNVVLAPLGYGRTASGQIGNDHGFNAYRLRSRDDHSHDPVSLKKISGRHTFAVTQEDHSMAEREPIRHFELDELLSHPAEIEKSLRERDPAPDESLYPSELKGEYQWGMSIDLNTCIGCNACMVACQSENNIPVVGKEQVLRGREMHWIRVDRYTGHDHAEVEYRHQPMLCMHCEKAPCEYVCPVAATLHDSEGLNEMVYNRCVGTRYCSNNCPYKVRRFNFFGYTDAEPKTMAARRNPDVSVRERGVMEKCTYCIQRINEARYRAELADRPIADGEIVPACQQACPTGTIVFGDVSDPNSRVSQLKRQRLKYDLLAELNTRPRTSYLAKISNPNPRIQGGIKR